MQGGSSSTGATVAGAAPQRSDRTRAPGRGPGAVLRAPAATARMTGESVVGTCQDYLPLSSSTTESHAPRPVTRAGLALGLDSRPGPEPYGHPGRGYPPGRADSAGCGPGAHRGRDGRRGPA